MHVNLSGLYTASPTSAAIKRAQKVADGLIDAITSFPKGIKGRGIVTCGGGYTYFTNAWVLVRMLRQLECDLPIQLWYLGPCEVSASMKRLIGAFGVECVDGAPLMSDGRKLKVNLRERGWILKSLAIAQCPFEEVIYLDADNIPIRDPSFLFETQQYKTTGAIFWPDSSTFAAKSVWRVFRVPFRDEPEFESGQIVIDKRINWEAVSLAEKINLRADLFYRFMWGDKDTFRFAWHKLGRSFAMPDFPPQALRAAGSEGDMLCQHDFDGTRLFQHRNLYKWDLYRENPWIPGFFFENECRAFLDDLRSTWNGRCDDSSSTSSRIAGHEGLDLSKKVWLLKVNRPGVEKSSRSKGITTGCCRATDNSANWIELKFSCNGTFSNGAGRGVGVFWDVRNSTTGAQLTLSDQKDPKVKLKRINREWRGHWFNDTGKVATKMLAVEDLYPHLEKVASADDAQVIAKDIQRQFGDEIHIGHSAAGIGDHIVATYACAALARTGIRVVFHTRQAGWLARIKEPGLTITSAIPEYVDHDFQYNYRHQLRYGVSRATWYAGGLHPLLKPVKPQVDVSPRLNRLPFKRYVIVAPFAWHSCREWPEVHWSQFAHLLRDAGYELIAIGGKKDESRLESVFGLTQAYWAVNHRPGWIMDAMLGAVAFVGVDSGMTHLAAVLGINAVAIHSQLQSEFLWPESQIRSVTPNAKCVFCRWQGDRGWLNSCETHCSALTSVRPESVLQAVSAFSTNNLLNPAKQDVRSDGQTRRM